MFDFFKFPILETDRLILRQLNYGDAKAIFELRSNIEVNQLITRKTPNNLNDAKAFIETCMAKFETGNTIFWVMEEKQTQNLIGTIVYHKISLKDKYAEIGYEVHPNFHRKGFMSEVFITVLKFGFQKMKLNTIEAFTHKNNSASMALLEKHHFVFQPERSDVGFENNRIFRLKR